MHSASTSPTPSSDSQLSHDSHPNSAVLCRLKSGQLLAIAPHSPGGLIIVKSFYADFAGPGAAVGSEFDRHTTAVYTIGPIQFYTPATRAERAASIETRIAYTERLSSILDVPVPLRRANLILEQFHAWLPGQSLETLPAELISKLVGISPATVKLAWHSHKHLASDTPTLITSSPIALSTQRQSPLKGAITL